MTTQSSPPGDIRRFIGLILMVVGALWLAASGLCSAAFLATVIVDGGDFRETLSIFPMIVFVGGISMGFGFGVL